MTILHTDEIVLYPNLLKRHILHDAHSFSSSIKMMKPLSLADKDKTDTFF